MADFPYYADYLDSDSFHYLRILYVSKPSDFSFPWIYSFCGDWKDLQPQRV